MTDTVLLESAALTAIPGIMVFLSLALRARANRWVNVIVGIAPLVCWRAPYSWEQFQLSM